MSFLFGKAPRPERRIALNVWPVQDMNLSPSKLFPEQVSGVVKIDDQSVGVACSGGGSRSHTLCAGYFRALRDFGVDDKVKYISSVSGGSWATSIYVFAKEDDEKLLGKSLQPEECTLETLKKAHPGQLAKIIDKFFGVATAFVQFFWRRTRPNLLWQRMIGHTLLRHFGLEKKVMVQDEETLQRILTTNANNEVVMKHKNDFVTPKKGRPFPIINACLNGPQYYNTGWGNSLQFTPLYSGVPFYRRNRTMVYNRMDLWTSLKHSFGIMIGKVAPFWLNDLYENEYVKNETNDETLELIIGGGVIDTFAFGTEKLDKKENYYGAINAGGEMRYDELFFLEDAVGASSAAFVAEFENRTFGSHIVPFAYYFPVLSRSLSSCGEYQEPRSISLGDGGNYENTGLLPLLQRGIKKAICFINAATPLQKDFKDGEFNNEPDLSCLPEGYKRQHTEKFTYCADTQLMALFGGIKVIDVGFNYTTSQVFELSALNEVMHGLLDSIKAGKGAVSKHTLRLQENLDWNIKGGYDVEILFVYNEHCYNFEKRLPQATQVDIGDNVGSFGDYPFYRTMFQAGRPFSLELEEINLLASQADFVLKENKDLVLEMFQ